MNKYDIFSARLGSRATSVFLVLFSYAVFTEGSASWSSAQAERAKMVNVIVPIADAPQDLLQPGALAELDFVREGIGNPPIFIGQIKVLSASKDNSPGRKAPVHKYDLTLEMVDQDVARVSLVKRDYKGTFIVKPRRPTMSELRELDALPRAQVIIGGKTLEMDKDKHLKEVAK